MTDDRGRSDRRDFLRRGSLAAGGLALSGAGLLAACGSSKPAASGTSKPAASGASTSSSGGTSKPAGTAASGSLTIVGRYPNDALTTGTVRLPISIADSTGTIQPTGPAQLTGTVTDSTGAKVASFTTPMHAKDIAVAYWPVTVSIPKAGIYDLHVDGAGQTAAFQVFDPKDVKIPTAGSVLPPFDTPTTADARGVNPVCTLSPNPCPFHAVSLADALKAGKPVAYFIGTPAHCQTGVCAPSLQFLVQAAAAYSGKVTFVHAEVYTDNTATTTTPAVDAYQLSYEPVLWLTDATGRVVDRVDVMWDLADITAELQRVFS